MILQEGIPITAKITLIGDGEGGTITDITTPLGNNISKGGYALMSKDVYLGYKGFYVSGEMDIISRVSGSCFFFPDNGYGGWVGKAISKPVEVDGKTVYKFFEPDTNIEADLTFTITGNDITFLVINFDELCAEWATKLEINGVIHDNMAGLYTVGFDTPQTQITIKILEWNKPNCLPKITRINTSLTLYYGQKNIQSLSCSDIMKANERDVSYGVVSQYGHIEFIDESEDLLDLSYYGLLQENLPVQIFLNGELYGHYLTGEWDYDYSNNISSVELVDELLKWDDVLFIAPEKFVRNYNYSFIHNPISNRREVLSNLLSQVDITSWEADSETNTILNQSISLIHGSLKWLKYYSNEHSVTELLNDLCEALQLLIYKNVETNKICVKYFNGVQ